jgi:hypothetical protein
MNATRTTAISSEAGIGGGSSEENAQRRPQQHIDANEEDHVIFTVRRHDDARGSHRVKDFGSYVSGGNRPISLRKVLTSSSKSAT